MGYWQKESEIEKGGCFKVPLCSLGLSGTQIYADRGFFTILSWLIFTQKIGDSFQRRKNYFRSICFCGEFLKLYFEKLLREMAKISLKERKIPNFINFSMFS